MKRLSTQRALNLVAIFYVSALIVGGIKFFSDVPFWDMWNGGLEWHLDLVDGGLGSFFSQHNEHRIVLTRMLFEIDYLFAGGTGVFLIACNYLLIMAIAAVLVLFVNRSSNPNVIEARRWLSPVLVIIVCSWVQHENLNWSFQSQFILVYLLPLISFVFIQRHLETGRNTSLVMGLLFGVFSAWTMANGQLALFVVGLALVIRVPKKKIGYIAIVLGVLSSYLYFMGYQPVSAHGSPVDNVLRSPLSFLQYICAYLGNPVFHLMGGNMASALAAQLMGLFVLLLMAGALFRYFVFLRNDFSLFAVVAGIIFILLSTFATAAGRVGFGVEQAFASRYSTPVLIAYALLLILFCGLGIFELGRNSLVSWLAIACVIFQFHIIVDEPTEIRDRRTAAIAIALHVEDKDETGQVSPFSTQDLWAVARRASRAGVTVFSSPPMSLYLQETPRALSYTTGCVLHVNEILPLEGETEYSKVRGWVSGLPGSQSFGIGEVFAPSGEPLGLANVGFSSPDLSAANILGNEKSGLVAYVKQSFAVQVGTELSCRFK